MKKGKIAERKFLEEGQLGKTPEFYKSLGDNPSTVRLRGMDIKKRIPTIELFISGRFESTTNTIYFNKSFQQPPLVTGLIIHSSDDSAERIYPNNEIMVVRRASVDIGTSSFPVTVGDTYRIKVYNLDVSD